MIRISEANAKMRLSNVVDKEDVLESIRLIKEATMRASIDPITGKIDMNILLTGYTSDIGKKLTKIVETVKELMI